MSGKGVSTKPNASEPLTRLAFSMHENPGVYALLAGSGLSRAAGIPTGWEITVDLIRRVATAQGETDQTDWAAWYRERVGREPDYSELVEELGASPDERRSILEGYIEPTEEERQEGLKVPTKAHRAIADLVVAGSVRVILTTNFDRLIENALREKGIEATIVDSVDALHGAEPLAHARCYVVKLHGDYKDARIRNTDEELRSYPQEFDELLDRIFDEYGLVVAGWSAGWDDALRDAILRSPSRRYSLFWAVHGKLSDAAQRLITHRRGHQMPIAGADEFFGTLRDRVQTLAQTRRQDPRNIELLVNSVKRFAAQPEHRVDLDDLLESEMHALMEKLRTMPEGSTENEVERNAAFHESATEALGRMAGALGRWGDGYELDAIVNALAVVTQYADEVRSGLVIRISMRSYPAVLLLAAYGLGLTHAKRWNALYRVLCHPMVNVNQKTERVVDRLFLGWEGADERIWHQMPGLERHHTPFSDQLLAVMDAWRISFASLVPDFEDLFDTWEILGSLAYCEILTKEQIDNASAGFAKAGLWIPSGRNGWRSTSRRRLITGILQNTNDLRGLADAGFGAGDPGRLITTLQRYETTVGQFYWR